MKFHHTDDAPKAIGPYSQAKKIAGFIFTAGQVALTPDGTIEGETAADQTGHVIANLRAVLQAAGAELDDVVKTTIFLNTGTRFAGIERFQRAES